MVRESLSAPGGRSRIDQIPPGTRIFSENNKVNISRAVLDPETDNTHFLAQSYDVDYTVSSGFDSQYTLSTIGALNRPQLQYQLS